MSAAGLVPASVFFVAGAVLAAAPLEGVRVDGLVPGGRGDQAGIKVGDVLTRCDGSPLRYPRDLRRALEMAKRKPTVGVEVFRGTERLEIDLAPGSVDIFLSAHRNGLGLFLAGRNADPKWNDEVRAGYAALSEEGWRDALGHFEKAVDAGLADAGVLRDLAQTCLACVEIEKAYGYAIRALLVDPWDDEAKRLRYFSCLMSGRAGEAASLAPRLPEAEWRWNHKIKRREDAKALLQAALAEARWGRDGTETDEPPGQVAGAGPHPRSRALTAGAAAVETGLVNRKGDELRELSLRLEPVQRRMRGGGAKLRDFVFSAEVELRKLDFNGKEQMVLADVSDESHDTRLAFGLDDRGRLLLGISCPDVVGPCEAVNAPPERNVFKIVRRGARVDAFVNERRVATTYVKPDQPLTVFIGGGNCDCRFEEISVSVPRSQDSR